MADVRPFRGVRFDPNVIGPIGPALCPPFDVITAEEEAELRGRHPDNAVQLELPHAAGDLDKYQAAAARLRELLQQGHLKRDAAAAFYMSRHTFMYNGATMARSELTAAVRLEPLGKGSIKPHEDTRAGAKQDRLHLMRAARTNISPIMLLYAARPAVEMVGQEVMKGKPTIAADLGGGERFETWVVSDAALTGTITAALAGESLYIADGHHRYETALNYRDELAAKGTPAPDAAANFVMATLISMSDSGLLSLPYHRVFKGLDVARTKKIRAQLDEEFIEHKHNAAWAPPPQVAEMVREHPDSSFEAYGLETATLSSFLIRRTDLLDRIAGGVHSRTWAGLAPSVFSAAVLRPGLGITEEEAEREGVLTFVKDAAEAVHLINKGSHQVAFLMKAVPMAGLKEVSDRGERLPPKATYFYPKLPTGLVLNPLEGTL